MEVRCNQGRQRDDEVALMAEATTPPNPADDSGSRPVPDPTILTTDALRREIAGLEKLIDTRLNGIEALNDEKFRSIQHQLDEADKQRLEQKGDTKAAVDAALTAQKEAITKTEASTADQIAQLNRTVDTKVEGLERSHSDLKDRVTVVESIKLGATEVKTEGRLTVGMIATVAATIIGFLSLVAVVMLANYNTG